MLIALCPACAIGGWAAKPLAHRRDHQGALVQSHMPDMANRRPGAEVARPRRQLIAPLRRDLLEGPYKAIAARLELRSKPGCPVCHREPPFSGRRMEDGCSMLDT